MSKMIYIGDSNAQGDALMHFIAARSSGAPPEELKRLRSIAEAAMPTTPLIAATRQLERAGATVIDIDAYLREREAEAKRVALQREWDDAS